MYFSVRYGQMIIKGDKMTKFAQTKDFCPNAACPDFGKLQSDQAQANLKKIGKTKRGVQQTLVRETIRSLGAEINESVRKFMLSSILIRTGFYGVCPPVGPLTN